MDENAERVSGCLPDRQLGLLSRFGLGDDEPQIGELGGSATTRSTTG